MVEYIEREALLEKANAVADRLELPDQFGANQVIAEIAWVDAADVEPVRRGHWDLIPMKTGQDHWGVIGECSRCGIRHKGLVRLGSDELIGHLFIDNSGDKEYGEWAVKWALLKEAQDELIKKNRLDAYCYNCGAHMDEDPEEGIKWPIIQRDSTNGGEDNG